jgi:hypothetical protein
MVPSRASSSSEAHRGGGLPPSITVQVNGHKAQSSMNLPGQIGDGHSPTAQVLIPYYYLLPSLLKVHVMDLI